MTLSTDALARAISLIGTPEFYWGLVDFLRSLAQFDSVVVLVFSGETTPISVLHKAYGHDVFDLLESDYLDASYLLDPIYQLHDQRGEAGIYRLTEIAPDHFQRSRYFKQYYRKIGMLEEVVIFLPVNEMTTITISLGKDNVSRTPFSRRVQKDLFQFENVIHELMRSDWERRKASNEPVSGERRSIVNNLRKVTQARYGVNLTKRQAEVALLVLRGHSTPSAAAVLEVSPQTVKVFRRQLYGRLNISSQSELFSMMLPILKEVSAFDVIAPNP